MGQKRGPDSFLGRTLFLGKTLFWAHGEQNWIEVIARRFNFESTLRPRARTKKTTDKESDPFV